MLAMLRIRTKIAFNHLCTYMHLGTRTKSCVKMRECRFQGDFATENVPNEEKKKSICTH